MSLIDKISDDTPTLEEEAPFETSTDANNADSPKKSLSEPIFQQMPRTCQIFRQSKVNTNLIADLPKRIEECFTQIGLKVSDEIKVLVPPISAWDKSRGQYIADKIVENACKQASDKICLHLLEDDAYDGIWNFVFGVAHRSQGCMVTLYRLNNDPDLIYKICISLLGHVFGL
uniref:Uncharacterized protein n=1 Tax=Acrobeloides nanus TaxID=290746 RepID=A0A914EK13_9BILA